MRDSIRLAGAAAALLLLVGAASADVVRLRDGDILEGKATDLGESVQVVTGASTVEIPWAKVRVIDREATAAGEFRDRLGKVEDGDAKGLLALALWCRRNGLVEESKDLAAKVAALEPGNEGARSLCGEQKTCGGDWKSGAALLEAKGFVSRGGKWILKEEAEALDRRAALERKATEEEARAARLLESLGDRNPSVRTFAEEALGSVDPALRRRLFLVGARHRHEAVRAASAAGLGVKGDEGAVRTLLQLAVKDPSSEVRAAAAGSLKAVAVPEAAKPLVRCLMSENAAVRMNAADALGAMGSRTAVETLIRRVHWVAGASNRANLQVLNQISYIGDYDVEIAQLAQIGDPIVMQLREGTILDVKVFGAEGHDVEIERRAYTRALANITGRDFGSDVKAWAKWWTEEGKQAFAVAEAEDRARN
jgi:hypothetical protein